MILLDPHSVENVLRDASSSNYRQMTELFMLVMRWIECSFMSLHECEWANGSVSQ